MSVINTNDNSGKEDSKKIAKLSPYLERILTDEQKEIMPDGKIRGIAPEIGHGITSIHLKPATDEETERAKSLISEIEDLKADTKKSEVLSSKIDVNNQEDKEIEGIKSIKNNKGRSKRPVIVVLSLLVLLLIGYFNFFYYPHDGRWETELYSREILLKVDKGEGIFKIGNTKGYDVLIFEPNKKNTTIGINGSSNRIDINKGVLMIELNNLYTSELGESNEVLYFKRD